MLFSGNQPVSKLNKAYPFLLLLTAAVSFGLQGWRTLFSNFAVHVVKADGFWIGLIESFREVPGLLSCIVVYFLYLFREDRLFSHSSLVLGLGIIITGLFPFKVGLLTATLIMSIGFHFAETCRQSLVLQCFELNESAGAFGYIRSVTAISNIGVGILIYAFAYFTSMGSTLIVIGIVVILASLYSYFMKFPTDRIGEQHKKMVIKRKYWFFYLLNFLAGSRKQIFIVFAVLLLVQHYNFSVNGIAILFIASNLLNSFMAEKLSRKIDDFGERKILVLESIIAFSIFMTYAFVENGYIAAALYIVDSVVFSFLIAIKTYLHKVAERPDIASSTAVGFTFNHIAAVLFPLVGGIMWMYDRRIPFIIGAVLSIISLLCANLIKLPRLQIAGTVTFRK